MKVGVTVEYDDGKSLDAPEKIKLCTRRNRARGFYVRFPNGASTLIPVAYMRVSEMQPLEALLNVELAAFWLKEEPLS